MIDKERVEKRIEQLQQEREGIVKMLQYFHDEINNCNRLLHSYDGAIGELSALLNAPELADEQKTE